MMIETHLEAAGDPDGMRAWLEQAKPADRVVYFTGGDLHEAALRDEAVKSVRDIVWQAYRESKVRLCQRRLREGRYAYIAERRRNVEAVQ